MSNDSVDGDVVPNETPYDEKKAAVVEDVRPVGAEPHQPRPAASGEELKQVFKRAAWYSLILTLIVAIIGTRLTTTILRALLIVVRFSSASANVLLPLYL